LMLYALPHMMYKPRSMIQLVTYPAHRPCIAMTYSQGNVTRSMRFERHVANAHKIAEWLEARDDVATVSFAGLASSPWNEIQKRISPKGAGAIITFDLASPEGASVEALRDRAWAFIDALKLHSCLVNIGDVRSLVCHPATTTHSQGTPESNARAGVTVTSIRLSVGIEAVEDIIADLE